MFEQSVELTSKKVLLCTITVGEGLNKMCKAVSEQLNDLNVPNEIIDVYKDNKERNFFNKTFYYNLTKFFPDILRYFQRKLANYKRNLAKLKNYNVMKKDIQEISKVLIKKYQQEKFDVLYTPVVQVALTALILKQKKLIDCKVIYNIPDFNIPVCTEFCKELDYIITPCDEISKALINFGFDGNKVLNYKFPIAKTFLENKDKYKLRKEYDIEKDDFVVLMMSGGYGTTNNLKLANKILKNNKKIHIIIVNGKNEKTKLKIDKYLNAHKDLKLTNIGFTKKIDELMTISDALYSKTGAATLTEAFSKNLVIITCRQKLYPESDNLDYLCENNSIIKCKNNKDLINKLTKLDLLSNDFEKIKENFSKILDRDSAKKIAKLLLNIQNQSKIDKVS